jgi:nucleotide-binding universal stress UspA family protein
MDTIATAPSPTTDVSRASPGVRAPDAIQSLLVHVDAGPHADARLRVARSLAQRLDATLTAFYAARPVIAQMSVGMGAAINSGAYAIFEEMDRSRRDAALARVEALRAEPGIPIAWQEARCDEALHSLARRSFYSDLLVLGQHDPRAEDSGVAAGFAESVLIESGSPALVLPWIAPPKTIGQRIVVAWKATASSGRALRAALPLLRRAAEVHVVSLGSEGPDADADALAAFLQLRGIESRLVRSYEAPDQVGDRLLSLAADVSADLMVMGCYGHSRARELMLGGVTRTVLRSMTLPVLMAH